MRSLGPHDSLAQVRHFRWALHGSPSRRLSDGALFALSFHRPCLRNAPRSLDAGSGAKRYPAAQRVVGQTVQPVPGGPGEPSIDPAQARSPAA